MTEALRKFIDDNKLDDSAVSVIRAFYVEVERRAAMRCIHHSTAGSIVICWTCLGRTLTELKRELLGE